MPYRNMIVRMFYSKAEFQKKTPMPFCELRVWHISEHPIPFPETEFRRELLKLEYTFFSIKEAREQNAIFFVEGREVNRRIDEDEAIEYLSRTGVKARYCENYRQAHFWHKTGRESVFNERDIREIEVERDTVNNWKDWFMKSREIGAFEQDILGLTMEELEEWLGL